METGILRHKGRVHFHIGCCINNALAHLESTDRTEAVHTACEAIDNSIHCGYRIFPCNYIAYDAINGTDRYAGQYSAEDVATFNAYIDGQLAKVDEPDITPDERKFMRDMMLTMYANPLKNQLSAHDCHKT